MGKELYISGEYLDRHPTWHAEDSAWKAEQIIRMLRRHGIEPATVCDVGCGAGEVLRQLQQHVNPSCELTGYDISPQAFQLCQERVNERLHFKLMDFLQDEGRHFDLLLLIDLIEHIEDYLAFLRAVKPRGRYKILHIPLELSVQAVLRPGRLTAMRREAGHVHHFTRETALHSLQDSGYEIVDSFLTRVAMETSPAPLRTRIGNMLRRLACLPGDAFAARLFGGFSLLVLAT